MYIVPVSLAWADLVPFQFVAGYSPFLQFLSIPTQIHQVQPTVLEGVLKAKVESVSNIDSSDESSRHWGCAPLRVTLMYTWPWQRTSATLQYKCKDESAK